MDVERCIPSGLNPREEAVARRFAREGWRILRGGAPDFLMLKVEQGRIRDVRAVEVKSPAADLTYEQSVYRMVFERAGIEYIVEVVE
jgi:dienelactone hydrolase